MEMGNSWEPGKPVMSTLALKSLLAFLETGKFHLCQQFIWNNPARLPSPAQWVNVKRIRVKDAYTHLWWMSPIVEVELAGQFSGPININVDQRGVYVADAGNNRIQSFIPAVPFDASSSSIRFAVAGFNQPAAVAAIETYTNEMFYVADTGNNQVVLCNVPNHNLDAVQSVWNSMTTHIAAGDISGAIPYYSAASQDKYRQAFLSVGTGSTMSAFGQIGTLTPSYIDDASAEYYFTKTINGQEITFPVEFDFENGAWKIVEF